MNINFGPKKRSGQSRYGRYGSYATDWQANCYAQGLLSNAWHFDLRAITLLMEQLLINDNVILLPYQGGFKIATYALRYRCRWLYFQL